MTDLSKVPTDARAFIGLSYGSIGIKWGPYDGPTVGQFMSRLVEADTDKKIPFFCSLEMGAPEDPVAELLAWGEPDPEHKADAGLGDDQANDGPWAFDDEDNDITFNGQPIFKVYRQWDFPCIEDEDRPSADAEYLAYAAAAVAALNERANGQTA